MCFFIKLWIFQSTTSVEWCDDWCVGEALN